MLKPNSQTRFAGTIGQEYELFARAVPHHDAFQRAIGEAVKRHFFSSQAAPVKGIEIGFGKGHTTHELLSAREDLNLRAIDNEVLMLHDAKNNLGFWLKSGRLSLIHADALAYLQGLDSCSVDMVASAYTIHNLSREARETLLKEIYRVVRPGGVFVNGDKYAEAEGVHEESLRWQLEKFDTVFGEGGRPDLRDQWREHYLLDDTPTFRFPEAEAIQLLERVGFTPVANSFRERMEAVLVATRAQKAV